MTFFRIVKHRSIEDFESFPYVIALLGTSLWCYKARGLPPSNYKKSRCNHRAYLCYIIHHLCTSKSKGKKLFDIIMSTMIFGICYSMYSGLVGPML